MLDVSAYGSGGYTFNGGVLTAGRTVRRHGHQRHAELSTTHLTPAANATLTVSGSLAQRRAR